MELSRNFEVASVSEERPILKGDYPRELMHPKKVITKEGNFRSRPGKNKVDRTYTKRRRRFKKTSTERIFKKNEIVWAMWIERDGSETEKVKTRPITATDFKKSAADFEKAHEIISAFLMIVTTDTKKGKNRTSVSRIDSQISNQDPKTLLNPNKHASPYYENYRYTTLQNAYLYSYFLYDPNEITKLVYASIARLMARSDYEKYYKNLLNQNINVKHFLSMREKSSSISMRKSIKILTKPAKFNNTVVVQDSNDSDVTLKIKFKR